MLLNNSSSTRKRAIIRAASNGISTLPPDDLLSLSYFYLMFSFQFFFINIKKRNTRNIPLPGVASTPPTHPTLLFFFLFFCDNYGKVQKKKIYNKNCYLASIFSLCPFTANSLSFRLGILYICLCPRFSFSVRLSGSVTKDQTHPRWSIGQGNMSTCHLEMWTHRLLFFLHARKKKCDARLNNC